jgi:hypothetical protein
MAFTVARKILIRSMSDTHHAEADGRGAVDDLVVQALPPCGATVFESRTPGIGWFHDRITAANHWSGQRTSPCLVNTGDGYMARGDQLLLIPEHPRTPPAEAAGLGNGSVSAATASAFRADHGLRHLARYSVRRSVPPVLV